MPPEDVPPEPLTEVGEAEEPPPTTAAEVLKVTPVAALDDVVATEGEATGDDEGTPIVRATEVVPPPEPPPEPPPKPLPAEQESWPTVQEDPTGQPGGRM